MTVETQNKLADLHNQDADVASSTESEAEEEHVHGEHCNHGNRNEKKAREIFQKLGMKPVAGIERVTLKRNRNMIFAISEPEVYQIGGTYIVFGEAKMDDPSLQQAAFAQQRLAASRAAEATAAQAAGNADESEETADATGLDEKDIKIVMEQGNVTRTKAIQTLRATKGDIVNAIMELSL